MSNIIRQGETFDFDIDLDGTAESGFTVNIDVMQYPGDTPAVSREVSYSGGSFKASITSAETTAMSVGQWFIYVTSSDSDENLQKPIKLYIAKGWV